VHVLNLQIVSFFAIEAQALARSKELMPVMPVRTIDVLYCNSLGKDLSGQGCIPRRSGGHRMAISRVNLGKSTMPAIHTIVGSRLSPGSHGNAIGVGLCEFLTQRFDEEIEWDRTTLNRRSALCPCQARRPIVCKHDRRRARSSSRHEPERPRRPAPGLHPQHAKNGACVALRRPAQRRPCKRRTWNSSPTCPPYASAATATLTWSRILGSGIRPTVLPAEKKHAGPLKPVLRLSTKNTFLPFFKSRVNPRPRASEQLGLAALFHESDGAEKNKEKTPNLTK